MLSTFATAFVLSSSPQPAYAQSLFVNGDGGQFGTLNVTNGVYARLGSTTFNNTTIILGGLANSANGNLYGLESNILQDSTSAAVLRLFQVDRTSGTLSLVGAVSTFTNRNRQGFASIGNTSDGTLYATYSPSLFGTNETLYTLNASSAVATQVGSTGVKFDGGIVGDSGGNIVGFGGEFSTTDYSISRTTGAATQLQSNAGGGTVFAAGFTNNNVYALSDGGGIYSLNTTTGALSGTGQTYNQNVAGLILGAANVTPFTAGATPEPGTVSLVGMGLVSGMGSLGVARRRRKNARV